MKRIDIFSAQWCAPCKLFKQIELPNLSDEIQVVHFDIDTEEGQIAASKNGVRGVPTIKLYNGDTELKTFVGMTKASKIMEEFNVS